MKDSQGKPWNPVLSEWTQSVRDEISGTRIGIFYATGICPGCGDMIDKNGKHSSVRNTCIGVVRSV